MYLTYYKPLSGRIANHIEIASELITLLLTYHLFLFTDFVPEPEVRYMFGYPFTGFMAVFIIVQLIALLLTTLVNTRNFARNWMAKRKKKNNKKEKSYQF